MDVEKLADETITVLKSEYILLQSRDEWLNCLEGAGVDNWEGFDYAVEIWEMEHPGEKIP